MKLNKFAFGLSAGIITGMGVFIITNFLLLIGSAGELISALNNIFFGYTYSFLGSFVGLIWGFVEGFIAGWIFALIYNLFAKQ
ncbi:MAG: hypothetical protein ACE5LC_10260 [Candidatus Aminicenantales bacterium]